MIVDETELEVVRQPLDRAEAALASIRRDILPNNPKSYSLMSESYIDLILELRAAIEAYLGKSQGEACR